MTVETVLKALGTVQEPDLGKDLVTLNMIRDIVINDKDLSFTVVLTTPACPLKDLIKNNCIRAIRQAEGNDIQVRVHFISEMNSHRSDPETVLPGVKNIIAVVSGKGGVGKSTIASNFALALAADGAKVGLMDADIYGPSIPIMFGLRGQRPKMKTVNGKGMILPMEKYGIRLMSIGLLVDEKDAVVWRGPMASSAIKQFVSEVFWDELDYLVIDMPPGTGDIHLTLMQSVPVTGVIVVSTPQDVALADAKKAIAMFAQAQLKAPVIGLVENMSYFVSEEAPQHKYYIFGKDGGRRLAEEYDIPFLGQVPLIQRIREGGDAGLPVMAGDDLEAKKAIQEFAGHAARSIAMINADIKRGKTHGTRYRLTDPTMYDIPYFKAAHPDEVLAFMKAHPFALICGVGEDHKPVATQVPFLFAERGDKLFLQGHFMKKQDHTNAFYKNSDVLIIFSGAHSYVSASWYSNPKVASTWNYQSVQVAGSLRFQDSAFLHELLIRLTETFEGHGSPALVQQMDPEYVQQLMKAIVAFEVEVSSVHHVFKLSQNRDGETQEKIISKLSEEGGEAGEVAKAMRKKNK